MLVVLRAGCLTETAYAPTSESLCGGQAMAAERRRMTIRCYFNQPGLVAVPKAGGAWLLLVELNATSDHRTERGAVTFKNDDRNGVVDDG